MISFSKILVPTDFSTGSELAYHFANEIAIKFGAKVDLVHIIPSFRYLSESILQLGLPIDMKKDIYPHLQKDAKEKLIRAKDRFFDTKVSGNVSALVDFKIQDAIIKKAELESYDLIVIGSQGANKNSLIHGTITDHVIRNSKVPVLSVPLSYPDKPYQRILLPTDGSTTSLTCLPLALLLLEKFGGELTILHVLELFGLEIEHEFRSFSNEDHENLLQFLGLKIAEYLRLKPELQTTIEADSHHNFNQIVIRNGDNSKSFNFKLKIIKGVSAHAEIVDFADEQSDLIVMSSHGQSALKQLFLGSTTEAVVRNATKSVLTFKSI